SPVCHHMQKTNLRPIYKILHEYTDKILARQLEQSFLNDYINKGWNILNKAKTGSLGGQKLYWTKERCIEKAKEYLTRNKFSKECSGAYASSIKNNWLDEVCSHMVSLIASPRDWNLKILQEEAIKYNTRKEFFNKSNTAYEYARKKKWLDLICSHMIHPTPPKKWTLQALKEEALKYKTRREFGLKNSSAYSIASKEGFIAVVCSHMELQHKTANHWTKEKCQERAFLYQTKMEFKRKDGSAYTTAVREKWITEICSHMVKPEPKRKWTVEALFIEAQKYNSIKSFKAKSQSAYVTAGRLGVLKQVCMHMSMNMKNKTKRSE
ncbi:MAG: hypothetical protein H6Q13_3190, partial [Bacteroidetes bacterium]|nr:hypothetical protein [Bacteroidota bacterium]